MTLQLGAFDARKLLANEIAVLEGRLEEAGFDPDSDEVSDDEAVVLKAIVGETETRSKAVRDEFLAEVSISLLHFAQRFGMHSLSKAQLRGNASLILTKGGAETSFSKVTKGERLRLKVATVLALIGLVPATIFWDNAWALCGSLAVFIWVYIWLYSRLVSWRRPAWLLLPSLGRHSHRK